MEFWVCSLQNNVLPSSSETQCCEHWGSWHGAVVTGELKVGWKSGNLGTTCLQRLA